jgi:hypothetical protein
MNMVVTLENSASFSLRRPGFNPREVNVGFEVDEVTLGKIFLRAPTPVLTCQPFHQCSITLTVIQGWHKRPISGRNTKGLSRPAAIIKE